MEDTWSGEIPPRRKSMPDDQQRLLHAPTVPVARSNSFKMPRSTDSRLSPGTAGGGGASKSCPTTPVELAETQASQSTTAAGSTQRAKTAWIKVKDIVSTARRSSGVDELTPAAADIVDDDTDPWIEKRASTKPSTILDSGERSSISPPKSSKRLQGQKRFSVSQSTSTSITGTALSNSPLDLAGLLGMMTLQGFHVISTMQEHI